jgi:hypothetical protein
LTTRKEPGNVLPVAADRSSSGTHRLDELVSELTTLRGKGLDRFAEIEVPALRSCVAELTGHQPADVQVHHLEVSLRAGVQAMGEGHAAECAAVLFGIAPHVRGLHPIELRKRAAELYYDQTADRNTVDAFRKTREPRILAALGAAILRALEARTPDRHPLVSSDLVGAGLATAELVVDQAGWRQRTLPVLVVGPQSPGQLRELSWEQFGQGIDTVRDQIHHYGTNLDIDIAIGINEAGLVMATLLASASFSRCAIGYVRTRSKGTSLHIDEDHTHLGPQLKSAAAVLICDYEVKTAHVLPRVCDYLHDAGLAADTPRYFAVMGALATEAPTLDSNLDGGNVSELACQPVLEAAQLTDAFIACVMASPGIDPPLGLR